MGTGSNRKRCRRTIECDIRSARQITSWNVDFVADLAEVGVGFHERAKAHRQAEESAAHASGVAGAQRVANGSPDSLPKKMPFALPRCAGGLTRFLKNGMDLRREVRTDDDPDDWRRSYWGTAAHECSSPFFAIRRKLDFCNTHANAGYPIDRIEVMC